MKEELQSKLVEILSSIQSATGKASDFAMEQLPDIAQQYVAYGRIYSVVEILLLAAVLILLAMWFRWTHLGVSEKGWGNEIWVLVGCFGGTAAAFTATALFLSLQSAALVWFAPKVWLIKELAALVK